jgi:serine protease Do
VRLDDVSKRENPNWSKPLILGLGVAIFALLLHGWVQAREQNQDIPALQHLSTAFTQVAKQALPAVVFIQVEKTIETSQGPFEFNDPFDLFNDEFFRRFFGRRFPRPQRKYRQMGLGSGFIISRDGYILTNHHVVGDADRIKVKLADGREVKAKLIGTDPKSDVAVIKIKGDDLPVLPLGDSDALEVGEWVIAIGNPFGLTHTITVGVVSAKGRSGMGIEDYEDFIQTDAAINPGNSGGPLINLRGEVIGINTAIFSRSGGYMGIGFAIPINMVKAIEQQLIATGKVTRGYLGVHIQNLTDDLAKSFGLENTEGVLIADVAKDSPASKAGIKTGDVIVVFDGKPVKNVQQLRNMVALTLPGTQVQVVVVRDREKRELTVTIGELAEEQVASVEGSGLLEKLGFAVQDLTPELAQQFGYEEGGGVLVSQVEAGSPAAMVGIRPGTLIRQVNRQPVHNTEEFMQALAKSEETKRVLFLLQDRRGTRFVALGFE